MTDELKNALPIGTALHHYTIAAVLGHGGFGIVYRGQHPELGAVAIKEYLPLELAVREDGKVHPLSSQSSSDYEEGLRRFVEEAKRLVQFNHANLVRCRDFFRANGTAYLVMDFEDGLPLSALLRQREASNDPLDEDDIKRIMLPLLEGLEVVHNHDVLHRDIKPANIFIRRATEQPVLIDFGAAKQDYSEHSKSRWAHTEGYAPMEQVEEGGDLGPWTDIYALGATMWRIIATANPPKVESRTIALARNKPDPLTPAIEIGEGRFSPAFLQVVDKCLALQEQDRYQSVAELQDALRGVATSGTLAAAFRAVPQQAAAAVGTSARRWVWVVVSVVAAAFAGSGYWVNLNPVEQLQLRADWGDAAAQRQLAEMVAAEAKRAEAKREAERYRKAAVQGYADAQYNLGDMYYLGRGVPQDYAEAMKWYRKAATQGHAWAQISLGGMYHDVRGVPKDYAEAMKWYRKAAAQEHDSAQYILGNMYRLGLGVPKDDAEAVRWYRKAAAQEHASAQYWLGVMYRNGYGVPKDDAEAERWFRKAARQRSRVFRIPN